MAPNVLFVGVAGNPANTVDVVTVVHGITPVWCHAMSVHPFTELGALMPSTAEHSSTSHGSREARN